MPRCAIVTGSSSGIGREVAQRLAGDGVEHGRDGIICNAVAPGKIVTGTPDDLTQDITSLAYVHSRTLFARLGQPSDVASAVSFLASDQATYISGINLLVDGGWMAY